MMLTSLHIHDSHTDTEVVIHMAVHSFQAFCTLLLSDIIIQSVKVECK
jgi:hypothetical protein